MIFRVTLFSILFLFISACAQHGSKDSFHHTIYQTNEGKTAGSVAFNGLGGSGRRADGVKQNGLGGSGKDLDPVLANGLGGSGQRAYTHPENGLGGSGVRPDHAAIFGSVERFGSIWVNGLHILLPSNTLYFEDGQPAERSDVRLGQMVAVLADALDNDDFEALEVHILYNVIGEIERVTDTSLTILGQSVTVSDNTRIESPSGEPLTLSALSTGQWIAISGLRSPDMTIKATLIQQTLTRQEMIAGPVSLQDQQYHVGDQPVRFSGDEPSFDEPLRMEGVVRDGFFIVNDWQPLPHDRIFSLADELWVEGYPLSDAEFFLEGFEISLPEFADDFFDPDDSVRIGIDREDHEFWMDHEPPEEDFEHWERDDHDRHHDREEFEHEWEEPDWEDDDLFRHRGPGREDFEPEDFWEPPERHHRD